MPDAHDWPRLLSLAVHEFRTPASIVGGYLRMLDRDTDVPLADRHRKLVEEAARSCQRLVALIAELSDVSKLETGGIALAHERFDLFALAPEVAAGVQEGSDRGVRIEVRGEASAAPVAGDRGRLGAAIGAILRAIAREQPSSCTVAVDRRLAMRGGEMSSAVLVVARAENVQAAYDSAEGPFDEYRGGLGLLLPLARRVIEMHGGRLWAPADAAKGAAIVSLPLSESQ
jgi:two-component system cell cycle sensor histidine kinase PleC